MLPSILLVASLLFGSHQNVTTYRKVGAWKIEIVRDRFTGGAWCRVEGRSKAGGAHYIDGALVFAFPKRWSTIDAWYRIDAQPPQRWQDAYPRLVQRGIIVGGPSLDNPSGGEVILPAEDLRGTTAVSIRARPTAKPRRFQLTGLDAALSSARRDGCVPDTSFIR